MVISETYNAYNLMLSENILTKSQDILDSAALILSILCYTCVLWISSWKYTTTNNTKH